MAEKQQDLGKGARFENPDVWMEHMPDRKRGHEKKEGELDYLKHKVTVQYLEGIERRVIEFCEENRENRVDVTALQEDWPDYCLVLKEVEVGGLFDRISQTGFHLRPAEAQTCVFESSRAENHHPRGMYPGEFCRGVTIQAARVKSIRVS